MVRNREGHVVQGPAQSHLVARRRSEDVLSDRLRGLTVHRARCSGEGANVWLGADVGARDLSVVRQQSVDQLVAPLAVEAAVLAQAPFPDEAERLHQAD